MVLTEDDGRWTATNQVIIVRDLRMSTGTWSPWLYPWPKELES